MSQLETVPLAVLQSTSARQTMRLGRRLGRLLRPGDVVGLAGDLGCGKTQLTKGIADGLGVDARYPICSPTFTLINEHPAAVPLIHMDLYRLGTLDEMIEVGALAYLGGPAVCVVEWFERCAAYVSVDYLLVVFVWVDGRTRELQLVPHGARAEQLARQWVRRGLGKGR